VADVRSVDPEVTGTPLQNYEAARQIRSSYLNATVYALGAIVVTLLIDIMAGAPLVLTLLSPFVVICFAMFTMEGSASVHPIWWVGGYTLLAVLVAAIFDLRSLRNTVLALSPPVLGLFLMFGIMGMLGMHLNPANMIVLPLILGIGVDNGVHMIHDFRHQRGPYRTSGSTINGLMMTSLTTMVGFGSMLVAAHQGLVTLGLVLVIGVGASLFVSLVTLPALLTLIGTGNPAGESEQESPQSGPTDSTLTGEEDQPHLLPLSLGRGSSGAA
jgi:predicted RND superfamily exporter protein